MQEMVQIVSMDDSCFTVVSLSIMSLCQLEEEQMKLKQAAIFKARPADVVHQEPFMPQRSTRPLTG